MKAIFYDFNKYINYFVTIWKHKIKFISLCYDCNI